MSEKDNCYDDVPGIRFIESVPLESLGIILENFESRGIYKRKYSTMKEAQYFLFDYIERYYSGRRGYSVISNPSSLQRKPFHNRVRFSGEVR
ncbi:hypothetical protein [Leptospira borgpetersenii]|uniref:hypothetical protein n=1 Tax=Leptospira borgpetersenii TaxID=174 RepID=UPI0007735C6A|nr:hypothetical protein [Leptospira borgpetersenii]MBE8435290.1 hypothetical protein [Leptospira borgpetersenii serovar Tarassovi]UVA63300.1 hypothetical protein LH336_11020 [Leptospira borgpetersenii]